MNLGKKVDDYVRARNKARDAEARAIELKDHAERLRTDLLHLMEDEGLEQAAGRTGTAYVQSTDIYQIEDREAFDKYVRRHNAFELYQARPAQRAIRDRVENTRGHRVPPGIKVFEKVTVNVRAKK